MPKLIGDKALTHTQRKAKYQTAHREKYLEQRRNQTRRLAQNPAWRKKHRQGNRDSVIRIKLEILSHYGPNGKLQCSWPDCEIIDPDMLSLDHIENDGASRRRDKKTKGGYHEYREIIREGFPEGFQTLCHNHQWKKEILRRREGTDA